MAFGRGRSSDHETAIGSVDAAGGLTAFIDQGSSFEGKLSFKDTVRIDGHFSGQITSENTLVVGETGEIEANISSQTVVVSGMIHGDVNAGRKVVLHKTARVDGNIRTPNLVMEEGAVLNGQLMMSNEPARRPAALKALAGGGSSSSEIKSSS